MKKLSLVLLCVAMAFVSLACHKEVTDNTATDTSSTTATDTYASTTSTTATDTSATTATSTTANGATANVDMTMSLANVTQQVYQMARAQGLNKQDGSAIVKIFEQMAGVTVKGD